VAARSVSSYSNKDGLVLGTYKVSPDPLTTVSLLVRPRRPHAVVKQRER